MQYLHVKVAAFGLLMLRLQFELVHVALLLLLV
jgi:hypothetical protein